MSAAATIRSGSLSTDNGAMPTLTVAAMTLPDDVSTPPRAKAQANALAHLLRPLN
ncbi:hypothetical protein GCM10017612_24990 [Novosphingobium resinovorum]|nr:hypothetical protein GCM10017612_24990 [Novosphingobium resinovorum]